VRGRLLAAVVLAAACTDTEFTPRWRVERLRVVAVVADPPDAVAGEAVTLTAVTAARAGATGDVRVVWAMCPRLVIDNTTGARRCDGAPAVLDGSVARVTLREAPAGGAPWTFFGVACLGGAIGVDPATAQPRCAGGDGEVFLRTVRARRGAANHNPRIARVTLGDVTLAADVPARVAPGASAALRVEFAADAREPYDEAQPDGRTAAAREVMLTEFLTDAGALDGAFRSDGEGGDAPPAHANRYTAPASGTARVWLVLSDGRGGFDVATRALTVAP